MSVTLQRRPHWSLVFQWLQRFGAFITVIAIAVFGFWGGHFFLPGQEHSAPDHELAEPETSAESNQITLPDRKLAAADLQSQTVKKKEFQAHKSVPGTITYDATRKVEIRATVDCIVTEILVSRAQSVQQGQPILVLTGPEVGAVRSEIRQYESDLELVAKEYAWTLDTHTNMKQLLATLDQSPTSESVRKQFENLNLGEHRNDILSAYAELELAKGLAERSSRLESQGAISGKTADQRKSSLDVATAKYRSIREEMTFQSSQQLASIKAKLEAAKKRLEIAEEKLSALLGPHADQMQSDTQSLTEFVVKAPRAGQIVALPAVASARFAQGEVMAEIADTSDVWIEAQISQRDWHALRLEDGQDLAVRVPALPNDRFTARVKHIGTSVSPTTMAIPLVAELANAENRFRPGMSIWVDIPTSQRRPAIVVPAGAVQRNESETFVFLQTGEATFEPRYVSVGEQAEDQIEILSGLDEGDQVVVSGAFFLKSEWLLAEEE